MKLLAWIFSPIRRPGVYCLAAIGVFSYSQTDAYALDGHGLLRLLGDMMSMAQGHQSFLLKEAVPHSAEGIAAVRWQRADYGQLYGS